MLQKGFLKPTLTIDVLGKKRFWRGVLMGVFCATVLSYFFNWSREALRVTTVFSDLFILPEDDFKLYDLFFAVLATSMGFGFTVIYWMYGSNRHIKKTYLKTLAISNSWFIVFMFLLALSRLGGFLFIVMYRREGYDDQLSLIHQYSILFILIPVYIFLANWNILKLMFKIRKWLFMSAVYCASLSCCLVLLTHANRTTLNQAYHKLHAERLAYVDAEVANAKKIGVVITDSVSQILKKQYAQRTLNLVTNLQEQFAKDNAVPLKNLVLEKIVIHNMNEGRRTRMDNSHQLWFYPSPNQVCNQLQYHPVDSKETKALFEILVEEQQLLKAYLQDADSLDTNSNYEINKYYLSRNIERNTDGLLINLYTCIAKLNEDARYKAYMSMLVPNPDDFKFIPNIPK